MKRTRIVATIGPASNSPEILEKMIRAGMNVARLNFSHGTYPEHAKYISRLRLAARRAGRVLTLLQDLSGPKIRVGDLGDGRELKVGQTIILSNNSKRKGGISFTYKAMARDVKVGDLILFDDGLMEAVIKKISGQDIFLEIKVGGLLKSHKGINVPGASLRIPAITEKDKKDLHFGLAHGVDVVALSFVRDPRDVEQLRRLIAVARPKVKPLIIVKVEKHEAVRHLPEIIHAADGIMVARGDLGVELPPERVPLIQKQLIKICLEEEKPVIVATQMLDSMTHNPRPTRAEVSDVANAVLDYTDAVMLSAESASGQYPLETVQMMARIIEEVEKTPLEHLPMICRHQYLTTNDQLLGEIAVAATSLHRAKAVLIPFKNRELAKTLSRFRPETLIVPQVADEHEAAQFNLHYGMYPVVAKKLTLLNPWQAMVSVLKKQKILRRGDRIVYITESKEVGGNLNLEERII